MKNSKKEFTALPKIIVAYDQNNAIGFNNRMPWQKMKTDLNRFKEITTNNIVVMGRNTYESIGKPLPNRENVVLSMDPDYKTDSSVIISNNLFEVLDNYSNDDREIFIIGGSKLYNQAIKIARTILATEIHNAYESADTYFPTLKEDEWRIVNNEYHEKDQDNEASFSFIEYRSNRPLADPAKGRSQENINDLKNIENTNICPFCEKRILDNKNELIEERKYWYVTTNYLPYKNTKNHLLLLPKRHIEHFSEIGDKSKLELMQLLGDYSVSMATGGIAMRFGEILNNGASVAHLHVHLIEPQDALKSDQKVNFKISR